MLEDIENRLFGSNGRESFDLFSVVLMTLLLIALPFFVGVKLSKSYLENKPKGFSKAESRVFYGSIFLGLCGLTASFLPLSDLGLSIGFAGCSYFLIGIGSSLLVHNKLFRQDSVTIELSDLSNCVPRSEVEMEDLEDPDFTPLGIEQIKVQISGLHLQKRNRYCRS